jgi:hypothetical protein
MPGSAGSEPSITQVGRPGHGPLGLKMSTSLNELEESPEEVSPFIFETLSVPKKHSAFESYQLRITPVNGLSSIRCKTPEITTSANGEQLREAFFSLKHRLERIYGSPIVVDKLSSGSQWNDENDWFNALYFNDRFLGAKWLDRHSSAMASSCIAEILLDALPFDASRGFLVVEYRFANYQDSFLEIELYEDDAL